MALRLFFAAALAALAAALAAALFLEPGGRPRRPAFLALPLAAFFAFAPFLALPLAALAALAGLPDAAWTSAIEMPRKDAYLFTLRALGTDLPWRAAWKEGKLMPAFLAAAVTARPSLVILALSSWASDGMGGSWGGVMNINEELIRQREYSLFKNIFYQIWH